MNVLTQQFANDVSTYLNKVVRIVFFISIFFLSTFDIAAQATLIVNDRIATTGETIDIPLKVTGLNNIFSLQFSVNWDSTVLAFKEVHSFTEALPQFTKDGIGVEETNGGKLIVIWFDNSLTGIDVVDSTEIITLRFEVIGEEGSKSAIAFTNEPALIEVVDATSTILDVEVVNGEVAVPGNTTSTTFLQAQNGMRLFQNHPNPFYKNTTIKASFTTAEWVILTIVDTQGRTVFEERLHAVNGINIIPIDTEQLSVAGTYTYTLRSSTHHLSRQMIVVPQ